MENSKNSDYDEDLDNFLKPQREEWEKEKAKKKKNNPIIYYYEEIKYELEYKWGKIRGYFFSIKYGIENLIKWFPIIWKDRDWDQWYLLHIMQKKLEGMEKLIRVHGNHVSAESDAKEIRICIELIKRINGEDDFSISDSPRFKELYKNVSPKEAYDYLFKMETYYKDELFNRMRKHITSWWD